MGCRIVLLLCLMFTVYVLALPAQEDERAKRDVMETMKNAWTDVVRTVSDAGDAVVHVFKPTEKSTIDKIADEIKNIAP